jgi:hypothetical protein
MIEQLAEVVGFIVIQKALECPDANVGMTQPD